MEIEEYTQRDMEIDGFMRSVVQIKGGCWLWIGALDRDGYGIAGLNGKQHRAHRLAYQWARGEIAEGLVVDHLCRITNCVNPDHLEAVTRAENKARGSQEIAHYRMLPPSCAVMPEEYRARMKKERSVRELPFFKELEKERLAEIEENKRLEMSDLAENGGFELPIQHDYT